ncbi:hypothetical protein C7N43_25585 [Sphingobacteriales bacterium UPWRP_1]|nr:hypothetical protein B6N25_12320 [Sphingobacteriales bacterium TSM_CSS]PSJ74118.1 hypothetical protein C7N43_25585 [Sphingobacteriales bacterium UPWRP_1]
MPTLHTTTLPAQYIGETTVQLPITGVDTFELFLQFTVFGELLAYQCPVLELPKTALKMMYDKEQNQQIKAEIEFLPYRLMLSAHLPDNETVKVPDYWQPVMQQLMALRHGKELYKLNVSPSHPYALELAD